MVGYKNEKYIDFGKVSARVDDVVNFIPARLTGLIFVPLSSLILGYNFKNSLKIFLEIEINIQVQTLGKVNLLMQEH